MTRHTQKQILNLIVPPAVMAPKNGLILSKVTRMRCAVFQKSEI